MRHCVESFGKIDVYNVRKAFTVNVFSPVVTTVQKLDFGEASSDETILRVGHQLMIV